MKPIWVKKLWSQVQTGKYGPTLVLTTLHRLLAPYSHGKEEARREYIFNVIALTLATITGVMFLTTVYLTIILPTRNGIPVLVITTLWFSFTGLFILGKYRYRKLARQIFLILLLIPCLYSLERWGLLLVMPLLGCSLIIVMAVILHNSRIALIYTLTITCALAIISWLHNTGLRKPDQAWLLNSIHHTYWVELSIVFGAIFIVAWLAEQEIKTGFKEATDSQQKLLEEQERTERQLEERTEELRKTHTEQIATLLKLAQYGQEFAGYFHDLVNPITAASLTLEEINQSNTKSHAALFKKAERTMHNVINFIQSIQKQLQKESFPKTIILDEEIALATEAVQYKIRRYGITLHTQIRDEGGYWADPIKLFQILSNLLNNAADACMQNSAVKTREVWLDAHATTTVLTITIRDTGTGIPPEILTNIFDPLVTTKQNGQSMGLGLCIVHHIVTQEYGGLITITDTGLNGTTFTLHIPRARQPIL